MFVQPKNEKVELWEGPRTGRYYAVEFFNADEAYDIEEMPRRLRNILRDASTVYGDEAFRDLARDKIHWDGRISNILPMMDRLRVRKTPAEIRVMRKAGQISGRAYSDAMKHRWYREVDLWAHLTYKFITGGCEKEAYVPVVAGGGNGRTIHYTRNNEMFK